MQIASANSKLFDFTEFPESVIEPIAVLSIVTLIALNPWLYPKCDD